MSWRAKPGATRRLTGAGPRPQVRGMIAFHASWMLAGRIPRADVSLRG